MRAELLIQTHKDQLIRRVKQLHNMDLNVHASTTEVSMCIYISNTSLHRNNQTQLSACTLVMTLWNA